MSPACLQVALETLARGAEGETLTEIDTVLGGKEGRTAAQSSLFKKPLYYVSDNYRFHIGTSVWADKQRAPLRDEYINSLKLLNSSTFAANFGSAKTKEQMDRWLSENTGGKFSNAPNCNPQTTLTIISALDFKDTWIDRLDNHEENKIFHGRESSSQVTMMTGFGSNAGMLTDVNNKGIAVSWQMDSGAYVVFTMPTAIDGIDEFIESGAAWKTISSCITNKNNEYPEDGIELTVPEFELTTETLKLKEIMYSMGVRRVFTPKAQLKGITKADIMLDSVTQSSKFKLDPNGVEGSAFTLLVAVAGIPPEFPPPPIRLVFDRPFAFALFSQSKAPLFVGTYIGN
ncbi:serpin family protein [Atopobium minutum]|uniref:serpin family protein n=1 Tax=Atopobium minutum TaxID=1381 RepID=UPI001E41CF42|nr:serpin family protein [Atopobium minutum]MDU5357291.1 serpin family protein [Atopobium minutum]